SSARLCTSVHTSAEATNVRRFECRLRFVRRIFQRLSQGRSVHYAVADMRRTTRTRSGASMSEPYIAIQIPMMPKDTNRHGTIFGGVLLSNIDLAGAIAAQREVQLRGGNPKASFVTVAINRVEFKKPVFVGDVVRFETTVV